MLIIDNQPNEGLTRKDIACSHTKKLIFEATPDLEVSRYYRAANEVTIGGPCLVFPSAHYYDLEQLDWIESHLDRCLDVFNSPNGSAGSLHIKMYFPHGGEYEDLSTVLTCQESTNLRTYEIFKASVDDDDSAVHSAYELQAVLHLMKGVGWGFDHAELLARDLQDCFDEEDLETPTGQVFLCDVPNFVLGPRELASATDPDEAAIVKICSFINEWPDLSGCRYKTKLDFFKSRVKLVKSGFRPTLADLYPKPGSK
jgi:hypothetical protein